MVNHFKTNAMIGQVLGIDLHQDWSMNLASTMKLMSKFNIWHLERTPSGYWATVNHGMWNGRCYATAELALCAAILAIYGVSVDESHYSMYDSYVPAKEEN